MSKVQKFLGIVLLVVCLVGCASSPTNNKSVISERQERMFWEITSPTGTTVYVLGTRDIVKCCGLKFGSAKV